MVDFQTLVLASLTLLTAAMFAFYYLIIIKSRRLPEVKLIRVQPPNNPVQAPTPKSAPILPQSSVQATSENPIKQTIQTSIQPPTETSLQDLPRNPAEVPSQQPALRGEAAVRALESFAEELQEKREDSEEAHNASLLKLARVLINVVKTNENPKVPSAQPEKKGRVARIERKQTATTVRKQDSNRKHRQKTLSRTNPRARSASPKTKKKETGKNYQQHSVRTERKSRS